MVFPYRTPASIDPDPVLPRTKTPDHWIRAVSAAAVLFLLTASAMMVTLIRDIATSRRFHGAPASTIAVKSAHHEALDRPALPAPPASAPRSAPSAAPARRVFTPPLGLASLGAATHDPAALLNRATRLIHDGAEITLTRSLLPMAIDRGLDEAFAPHARIAARFASGGIELRSLPRGSTAALAGLQRGDVVTAINGYELTKPESALDAYSTHSSSGVAVIELIRDERRIVLEARFTPKARPARVVR